MTRPLFTIALSIFSMLVLRIPAAAQVTGRLQGYVRDAATQLPLSGVTVRITGFAAVTDSNGYYSIRELPTRTYTVELTATAYRSAQKFDIVITSGNATELNVELEREIKELSGVIIRSGFFKPVGSPNSVQTLGTSEIARYPGANFDIAKVVQSLPGVSGSVGFRNDIIIRGGAPNENVYYLDGMEIPTVNHFATQGAAGGPAGILNVSFIEGVTLHTSAFPARYDNPLSGVLQFRQRTGNPEKVEGLFRLSASELALTTEGPLSRSNQRTTFLASVRRSYLQLLFRLIDLPFLPDYWDYQYKVTHKPDKRNEINLLGIGSIDNFTFNEPKDPTLEQRAILDQVPLNSQRLNVIGLSWRHTMKKGFWLLVASKNTLRNNADKFESNDDGNESRRILRYRSTEDENRLRWEATLPLSGWNVNAGASFVYADYSNQTYQRRAGSVADYASAFGFSRYGAFLNISRRVLQEKVLVSAGMRTDGNGFMTGGKQLGRTFSPRLALTYTIRNGLNWNLSAGRYFKLPPYTILGFRQSGQLINRDARYIRSDHLVSGLEWQPRNDTRITVEGFYKKYDRYPISVANRVSLANFGGDFGVLGNERTVSDGKGRAWGGEFMYQKRLTRNFYGILAYTFYHSEFTGLDGRFRPTAWDYRHLVSFTGGYKFGRNWELGLRFRYQGRAPATPYDLYQTLENYPFTNEPVLDYSQINTLRLRAFNAADIRIDKQWNFRTWTLDLFLDLQNAYNSTNPTQPGLTLQRNPDGSIATDSGTPYAPGVFGDPFAPNNRQQAIPVIFDRSSGSFLPSIGLIIGF